MGMTTGKQLALVEAHCILGYYYSSAPVLLWKSKCSWKLGRFYLEFSVLYVKESSIFHLTMAPAKSRKIVVMGFRSVGNFWIVLAILLEASAAWPCYRFSLNFFVFFCIFLFRKIFNYNSVCGGTICGFIRSDNWEQWVILLNSFEEKKNRKWNLGPLRDVRFKFVNLVGILHVTSALSFFSAFTTKLKHNSQEYILEVVDTAGQVNIHVLLISPCSRVSKFSIVFIFWYFLFLSCIY